MTSSEFVRITGVVLGGLKAIFTNFAAVSDQLSGPVAIVAKGSEIARADSAGAPRRLETGAAGPRRRAAAAQAAQTAARLAPAVISWPPGRALDTLGRYP
jgi:hypothetical protein